MLLNVFCHLHVHVIQYHLQIHVYKFHIILKITIGKNVYIFVAETFVFVEGIYIGKSSLVWCAFDVINILLQYKSNVTDSLTDY